MMIYHACNQIVWIPLGQAPVIDKLQSLALQQLNGHILPADSTPEERKELLRRGFVGKCVLLCLDDCWESEHEEFFNFLDATTTSRVMISTRVRGILSDAAAVEVGVPSEEEAINILLNAAELSPGSQIPTQASEIVALCGKLPLALGMAGRLIKELEVGMNWAGVTDILRDEFVDSMSSEQRVIKASLAGLKGSQKDKDGCTNLFKLFGLVPEDTSCPLACLGIMYDAVYQPASGGRGQRPTSTPLLHIRKWLKVLSPRKKSPNCAS